MTYKQIDASRELRLWITGVIVPGVIIALYVYNDPVLRGKISYEAERIKYKVKSKFSSK